MVFDDYSFEKVQKQLLDSWNKKYKGKRRNKGRKGQDLRYISF